MFLRHFHGMTILYCFHVYPLLSFELEVKGFQLLCFDPGGFELEVHVGIENFELEC